MSQPPDATVTTMHELADWLAGLAQAEERAG